MKHKKIYLCLCLSFVMLASFLINNNTIHIANALSSWNPQTGFQNGISAFDPVITIPTQPTTPSPIIVSPLPYIKDEIPKDGRLNQYQSLRLNNEVIENKWKKWAYLNFIEYFEIVRTDGRLIYDNDGIFDPNKEIIDYPCELYVKTRLTEHSWGGFFGTMLNAKFKSGAKINVEFSDSSGVSVVLNSDVHDNDANTIGTGQYRNNGVNPSDEKYKIATLNNAYTIPYSNSQFITIKFVGTAYWENAWWGGSFDFVDLNINMVSKFKVKYRDWRNELTPVTDYVKTGTLNGKTVYYSAQPFVVKANNLNNLIYINGIIRNPVAGNSNINTGIIATPMSVSSNTLPKTYDLYNSVVPFVDGHRIAVGAEGITSIEIENGNYYNGQSAPKTQYYCCVDTIVPDFNVNALNENFAENIKVSNMIDEKTGARTQIFDNIKFKDKVQILFSFSTTESPEKATVVYDNNIINFNSGDWLSEDKEYIFTITDTAGNKTIMNFEIDSQAPYVNNEVLNNSKDFKISKWYKATMPFGFDNYGVYSFSTYENAKEFAINSEIKNCVTTMILNNIADFINLGQVADNGDINNDNDKIRTGEYWLYKSLNDPDILLYYFDKEYLNFVIEKYAIKYISDANYYNLNSDMFTNDYASINDNKIFDNIWNKQEEPAYIANNFTFEYINENETYKIFYNYIIDNNDVWTEFNFDIPFSQQVSRHGLYKIKQVDFVGNESNCYVFLDLQAPIVEAEVKNYGSSQYFIQTINENTIPKNNELVYYYENFKINKVIDNDTWWVLKINCPNGKVLHYTHEELIPDLAEFGSGEYSISVYDRTENEYSFKVCMLGKAPKVIFNDINTNNQCEINILTGEDYNGITALKIYKNNVLLNNVNGYDEFPERIDDELINISPENLHYIFNKGGNYVVEITDNFGRVLISEHKFDKNLPKGVLIGVEDKGKCRNDVTFSFNNEKYFAVITKNGQSFTPISNIDNTGKLTQLSFLAYENTFDKYVLNLYNKEDVENFNTYKFDIITKAPSINLFGVENCGTSSADIYATWELNENIINANYTLNGIDMGVYSNGQILNLDGKYQIIIKDDLLNESVVNFVIDKTLDFTILADGQKVNIENVRYTNQVIEIVKNEKLNIALLKNSENYEYDFGDVLSDEGEYVITINDNYGNIQTFKICIDRTKPFASLFGVEEYGITSGQAYITWDENDLSAVYYINDELIGSYSNGQEMNKNGKYKVVVYDKASNHIDFEFTIDNKIDFEINIFDYGISNGGVIIKNNEYLTIELFKNNVQMEYVFGETLNEDGIYLAVIKDEFDNATSCYFQIINKPKRKLEYILPEHIEIESIVCGKEFYTNDEILANKIFLYEDNTYTINLVDNETQLKYTFDIVIDTIKPTISILNVNENGKSKGNVIIQNPSKENCNIILKKDNIAIDYVLGKSIDNVGKYDLTIIDEAGNFTTYQFEIIYSLNGASIGVIAGLLALVIVGVVLLFRNRRKTRVRYEIETEIEDDN